jgi:RNA polymerase sigma-70 factor (ECF subfamily)
MGGLAIARESTAPEALVKRVLRGDPAAERALYDANVDRVYRLTYRMVNDPTLAEEYTQETFIRVFDRLGDFRGEAALSTWIASIAISVVYNGMRKVKRFRERERDLDTAEPMAAPARETEPDLKARMAMAIDDLPKGYRTVFVMHDVEGFTHEEIGFALGIREGTSKAQLSRARAKLRAALAVHEGEWA